MHRKQRILIAPLDWGLGHASRCVPLIREKCNEGNEVFLAANGASADLLAEFFPDLPLYRDIPAYAIHYSGRSFLRSILSQLPHLFRTIRSERKWLENKIVELALDEVISDNRYGLSSNKIQSIFITHQLFPIVPEWSRSIVHRLIKKYILQFDQCIIPDFADSDKNLSGILSHGKMFGNYYYAGLWSRFTGMKSSDPVSAPIERKGVLAIISGPEPQRSELEKILFNILKDGDEESIIVCGSPGRKRDEKVNHCRLIHHLGDQEMFTAIQNAGLIICRSGYSTIMDLETIGRKALLVPTPGQTEQEYLAQYLHKKGYAQTPQNRLNKDTLQKYLTKGID